MFESGATYGREYWDFPFDPARYSFTRALNVAGYATFNYDRVGIGESSHPLSPFLTIGSNAFVAHQIVGALRSGAFGHPSFGRVVIAGHSLGSAVAATEASTYHDVDALIMTALGHGESDPSLFTFLATAFTPAALDPRFAGSGLDPGYLTTKAGTRGSFYAPGNVDPRVISADEQTKETVTGTELATQGSFLADPGVGPPDARFYSPTASIDIPVLAAVGQLDAANCNLANNTCPDAETVRATEAPYYPSAPSLEAFVLPGAGHDMNLHLNSVDWYQAAIAWMNRIVPL